jgi:AFG3 family protein
MAYARVAVYGMNEKVGMLSFPPDNQQFQKPYSQETANLIDEEVRALVSETYKRTVELITKERAKVEALAQGLLEKEVLQRHDLVTILGARPFKYEGQQNIDILDQGFRMPELSATGEEGEEDAAAAGGGGGEGGGGGGDGPEKDEEEAPAGAFPVAS